MGNYVRYTCKKKNEPVFERDCKNCSEYNPCAKGGNWCFIGALVAEHYEPCESALAPIMENAAAPVLRDMSTVTINLGNGTTVDVLREDMNRQLERELLSHLNLPGVMYGA